MDTTLVSILTSIGLTDKESKVYLACTEQGAAPVSKIANSAGINRVTTYDVLEKLKQKGFVSFYTKQKVKYFSGIDPEIVLEEFEKKTSDLRSALPQFKRLKGETNHPRVRYFEGLEGIKTIYADTLNSESDILNISNTDEILQQWPTYNKDYVSKRAKKGIFLRGIALKDSEGVKLQQKDQKYHREFRLIKPELFNFTNEINIYDDKVSIISFKDELIGMIIESPEISNSQRAIFNICWEYANMTDVQEEFKSKMLKPLSGPDLTKSIENTAEDVTKRKHKSVKSEEDKKTEKEPATSDADSNLSLF